MAHLHGSARKQSRQRLLLVLGLATVVLLVELVVGLRTGSLVLLADAAHMFSDVAALGLALFALWFATRPSPPNATFGYYRIEILIAVVNAVILTIVCFFVVREAIGRLHDPPPIDGVPVILTGFVGLLANIVAVRVLHSDAQHNLNIRGAYLEVLGDTLASVAVIVSAFLVLQFGWVMADPILSLMIALFILPRIFLLLRDATDVLMEAAPRGLNLGLLKDAVLQQEGVEDLHDLHVWTITSGRLCLSAHVVAQADVDRDAVIQRINELLRSQFHLDHTTLQVEGGVEAAAEVGCDPCL
jgi:cobalt-zinc-cadmium efflux system protein